MPPNQEGVAEDIISTCFISLLAIFLILSILEQLSPEAVYSRINLGYLFITVIATGVVFGSYKIFRRTTTRKALTETRKNQRIRIWHVALWGVIGAVVLIYGTLTLGAGILSYFLGASGGLLVTILSFLLLNQEESTKTEKEAEESVKRVSKEVSRGGGEEKAYCLKCKARRRIKNPRKTVLENGRNAVSGQCEVCGSKVFRMA